MQAEFYKTHHTAFLHLSSVHLLATDSDLHGPEAKIRLVKFWTPASEKTEEKWTNGLVCEILI